MSELLGAEGVELPHDCVGPIDIGSVPVGVDGDESANSSDFEG